MPRLLQSVHLWDITSGEQMGYTEWATSRQEVARVGDAAHARVTVPSSRTPSETTPGVVSAPKNGASGSRGLAGANIRDSPAYTSFCRRRIFLHTW